MEMNRVDCRVGPCSRFVVLIPRMYLLQFKMKIRSVGRLSYSCRLCVVAKRTIPMYWIARMG